MCSVWNTACILAEFTGRHATNSIFSEAAEVIITAEQWLIHTSASWWVMVPSISLYPDADNTDPNAAPIDTVVQLRALILPLTVLVAVGGMMWNGLLMVLSRKPAPLANVLRGLWNTALWSAVGVFGTNLLLAGVDAFSTSIIKTALKSAGDPSIGNRLGALLVPVGGGAAGLPVGALILLGTIAAICAFIQALLMLFRDGAVLILSATTPLAASGSFTNATGGWLRKILAWQLALIFYKAVAAMVYATMIWLTNDSSAKDPRVLLVGMAMMAVALVALPVLLRFFNWTIGGLQPGGGGLGLLATAGAAGLHAGASLRGVGGGTSVNEHARYIGETFGRGASGGAGGSPGPAPARPPTFTPPPSAAASAGGSTTAAAAGGATTAAGGATSAAMAGSAATGPAAPVVATGAAVLGAGVQVAKAAGNAAAAAAAESTKES